MDRSGGSRPNASVTKRSSSDQAAVEKFAGNLTRCKKRAGLSQPKIADRAGLSRGEISQLERAKREPRLTTIAKLAEALEVEISELFEGIGKH